MNGGLSMVEMKSGYKMTEVGVIPEDWEVKEFNETFSVIPNNSLSRDYLNTHAGEYHDIHYGDVLIRYGALLDAGNTEIPFINKAITDKWVNRRIVTEGDIIMADTAEDNTVGKCSEVINVNHKKIVSGLHTFWLHPNEGLFEKGFLGYFMNHSLYHNQLLPLIHGTKVSSVSKNEILGTRVLVPLKNEQTAIATALSDVDSLISALTKKIEKKKAIKQGLMQQLLTGKKRLPGFNDKWKSMLLGDIAEVKDGTHQTPQYVKSGGKPFYSVENVTADDFKNVKHISLEEHKALTSNYRIEKGDVLMTRIGSIGCCKYVDWDVDASFYVSLALLKINEKYDSKFISYLSNIKSFKEEVMLNSLVFAIPQKINLGNISLIKVYIPTSKVEQTAIANILSDCDSEIAALEEKRDKYKEIKQGMMQQLLTGKIRLIK